MPARLSLRSARAVDSESSSPGHNFVSRHIRRCERRLWGTILPPMHRPVILAAAAAAAFVLTGAQSCSLSNPSVGGGGSGSSSAGSLGGAVPATLGPTVATHVSSVSSSVARGQTASLQVTTTAGASCSISVNYKSGPSKAASLHPQTADSSGRIQWSWKVGTRTIAGTWPIVVKCNPGGDANAQFTVP